MYIRSPIVQDRMLQLLYKYLVVNQQASLPGLGAFKIERQSAKFNFEDKTFAAPASRVAFSPGVNQFDSHFYSFVASEQSIEETEAIIRVNQFVNSIKNELTVARRIQLPGFGSLSKAPSGELIFDPISIDSYFPTVSAEIKLTREPDQTIVPGNVNQFTETSEVLSEEGSTERKTDYWWVFAIIIALLAIAAIAYYYYENGSFQ